MGTCALEGAPPARPGRGPSFKGERTKRPTLIHRRSSKNCVPPWLIIRSEQWLKIRSAPTLNKIIDLLDFAVRHCDLESYLDAKRAEEERDRAYIDRWKSRKRSAFVERMKQAKATKRAERAATGAASADPQSVPLRPLEYMRCDHHG